MNDKPRGSELETIIGTESDVQSLSNWLIEQAFGDPDVVDVFVGLCERLLAIGIQIDRANFAWPTLHPLFDAEAVVWYPGKGATLETLVHGSERTAGWMKSPMKHAVENDLSVFRRRLSNPSDRAGFPILQDLADQGMTDYLLFATRFTIPRVGENGEPGGVLVSWSTKRPDGFTDREFTTLKRLQGRLAIAAKTILLSRVTRNIADAYLGRIAGGRVLSGQIRHGDGESIEAVVWYSDLRNSTALAESMPEDDYMQILNRYFECSAGAALANGGEVLDFIGDAVLAIFPHEAAGGLTGAAVAACKAIEEADRRRNAMLAEDPSLPLDFGVGIDSGRLKFGNIGVPERLAFSVIGPTVNQVARIEKYTKTLGVLALATPRIADASPGYWRPVGDHSLLGLSAPVSLYAWEGGAKAS
jgi:adenylate cyclase